MSLTLPAGDFRAYLFDCDGTIVDSMPLHYIAWKTALTEWNCPFDEMLFYSWGGRPIDEIIGALNQMHGLSMPVEDVARHKEQLYFEQLPNLQVIPEVVELINVQHGRLPFAVVYGGRPSSVTRSLTIVNLLDKFETIVGAGDYVNAKPAPDCYLLGAQRLGIAPEHCLVFEDTDMGIESATAAGMASVRILQPHERANGTAAR